MKKIILLLLITLSIFSSCEKNEAVYQCPMQCEGANNFSSEKGSCAVCKMDLQLITKNKKVLANEISEDSIFNLTSKWNTEEGEVIQLSELKGKTLVMVMIYTSCKAACPRLVADMRSIEKKIPKTNKDKIQYVLISIDPETDTPKRLKSFAKENFMDGNQWTFLQGTKTSVREFANVLAVKYKEISPLDFSHSNIISVFNQKGELVHQQEGLGVDNKETISKIVLTSNN